ncbi:LacI family transcriptional regulator [Rathayibacter festucae]|uniref:LacI family DNA-binding transcriptional regulator n=1 Tax=Rathayibacter festucae TaxID=110937 RepID=UPI001FB264C2|nr:LacI family DNA-binding transcriptional regulator [Rathayibacter festucae]MCJ1702100.1 LacI family transcriptional regulator [Rathayibacter festucae]
MERSRPAVTKAPTILDVAVAAGVSKSAVSRALLGQGEVSEATREKVQSAADRLGYVANGMARGLVSARTHTIGAVLRDLTRPFYSELLSGMQASAEDRGYQVLTMSSAGELELDDARRTLRSLISLQVDGLVVASAQLAADDIVPFVDRTPIIVSGRAETTPGITSVYSDDTFGGRTVADRVIALGHRSVAVAVVDRSYSLSQHTRGIAMIEQIRAAGLVAEEWPVGHDAEIGTAAAQRLEASDVTAVMCPTDGAAVDVMEVLRQRGLSAPADMTVTGYDAIGALAAPFLGLTTYRVPVLEIGRASVDLLIDKIQGKVQQDRSLALRGTLIEGRTAGRPARP